MSSYAISDLHGMFDLYQKALECLSENDTLFVIGDTIDRGHNGIQILLDITSRKNVKLILGNHECSMIETINLIKKYHLNLDDIKAICHVAPYVVQEAQAHLELQKSHPWESEEESSIRLANAKNEYETALKYKSKILQNISHPNISNDEIYSISLWLTNNNGFRTLQDYLNLPLEQQDKLFEFLKNSMLIYSTTINNEKICMVHAYPPCSDNDFDKILCNPDHLGYCTYTDINPSLNIRNPFIRNLTCTRNHNIGFLFMKEKGFKTIYGHTPQDKVVFNSRTNSICIDGGCFRKPYCLPFYSIDDNTITYLKSPKQISAVDNNTDYNNSYYDRSDDYDI